MRDLILLFLGVAIFVSLFGVVILAQTQLEVSQIKPLMVSPIAAVERYECNASGAGTGQNSDGSSYTYSWDCTGMQSIRLVLDDGTIIGPFVGPMAVDTSDSSKWTRLPLRVPPQTLPAAKKAVPPPPSKPKITGR